MLGMNLIPILSREEPYNSSIVVSGREQGHEIIKYSDVPKLLISLRDIVKFFPIDPSKLQIYIERTLYSFNATGKRYMT